MTKKKVVVKVFNMNGRNEKCLFPNFRRQNNRLKALQIATTIPGFQSLSLKGTDQDVIEVTGDDVDAVDLATKLRRSVGHAKLETVEEVKEEKKEEKQQPQAAAQQPQVAQPLTFFVNPPYDAIQTEPACCAIM